MKKTTTEIMALADAYAGATFEQGLNQVTDTPVPEQKREAMLAAITELEAVIAQPVEPVTATKANEIAHRHFERHSAYPWEGAQPWVIAAIMEAMSKAAPQEPAAPAPVNAELLDALKSIVEMEGTENNEWDGVERVIPEMCDIARAAIKKAEGAA